MSKLKQVNFPLLFLALYLIKLLILPALVFDIGIMFVLMLAYLADKVKDIFMEYYKVKQSVISENEFRNQVNQDIANMKTELSTVKLTTGGLNGLGGRR